MTASEKRQKVVDVMRSWLGRNEADGSHKYIIDIYNGKNARGIMGYDMEWCAATVSAAFIKAGLDELITPECSCWYMVEGLKAKGAFVENESFEPKPGDIIFYNWSAEKVDHKNTDNTGTPEHTGIVEAVNDGIITTIEGNYSNSVKRRYIELNGRYIRGYGVPKYTDDSKAEKPAEAVTEPTEADEPAELKLGVWKNGDVDAQIAVVQVLLRHYGFDPKYIDGEFGGRTETALKKYQVSKAITPSGCTDEATWQALLKG